MFPLAFQPLACHAARPARGPTRRGPAPASLRPFLDRAPRAGAGWLGVGGQSRAPCPPCPPEADRPGSGFAGEAGPGRTHRRPSGGGVIVPRRRSACTEHCAKAKGDPRALSSFARAALLGTK
jgi:hypothetical protein